VSDLPWIIGGGAIAAYLWTRGAKRASASPARASGVMTAPGPSVVTLTGRWVWPVASWNGRRPVISDGFNSPRPGLARHGGADIMFRRESTDIFVPGTPNGSKMFVMPDDVPVLAAADGVVWSAMQTPHGSAVVIDHAPQKVATFYTHLDKLFVAPTSRAATKQRVKAGQAIGTVGFSPLDVQKLKHLHFEVWLGGPTDAIDPASVMQRWDAVADPRQQVAARNAGFAYRPVGASGEPYPQWVRDLKGKSGVYVIRELDDNGNGETVYVGSSVGRLYDTLTRHLQTWRRWKGFWKGQYGEGHDPGLTYDRDRVEIAVRLTKPSDALDEEARLIHRLRPRDNLIGQRVEDEVPF
jgi:hypothetical protein